uniref:Hydin adenylate kinase-like domain-containing protein n=1 Tax=Cyprinus carpio TaxID=7962 RepID=A0A8C1G562_CYPCA
MYKNRYFVFIVFLIKQIQPCLTLKSGAFPNRDPLSPNKPRNKKSKSVQTSVQEGSVFSVSLARLSLPPGHSADMLLEGSSDVPKTCPSALLCIMTADVTCQYVSPAVYISSQQINFYVENVRKNLSLTSIHYLCRSSMAVHVPLIKCPSTFYDVRDAFRTAEKIVCSVFICCFFNIFMKFILLTGSRFVSGSIVVLRGEVHFPNLKFSSTTLDFGCILNNTKSRRKLTMTNCSPLCKESREAQWELLEQREADGKTDPNKEADIIIPHLEEDELHHKNRKYSTQRPLSTELGSKPISLTPNGHPSVGVKEWVFDISSLYRELHPGDTKLVTFSFLDHADLHCVRWKEGPPLRSNSRVRLPLHMVRYTGICVSGSQNEVLGLISCLLPDDVLVQILSERLQVCTFFFREQDKFDQEKEERRQQELENLREEDMTPSEDWDTKPEHEEPLPLSEDLQQELVVHELHEVFDFQSR